MDAAQQEVNRKIADALHKHADMVRRISFLYLRSGSDVDDVFQDVFLRLLQRKTPFENEEHEKAWLIRVTTNRCKDLLRSFWHRKVDLVENTDFQWEDPAKREIMQAVLSLPPKYKDVIYLYYYEGYSIPEIAEILDRNEHTLYSHLRRAKAALKQRLGGNEDVYSF